VSSFILFPGKFAEAKKANGRVTIATPGGSVYRADSFERITDIWTGLPGSWVQLYSKGKFIGQVNLWWDLVVSSGADKKKKPSQRSREEIEKILGERPFEEACYDPLIITTDEALSLGVGIGETGGLSVDGCAGNGTHFYQNFPLRVR
jgi:hypothetical protein